jgi:hypothetical protein
VRLGDGASNGHEDHSQERSERRSGREGEGAAGSKKFIRWAAGYIIRCCAVGSGGHLHGKDSWVKALA